MLNSKKNSNKMTQRTLTQFGYKTGQTETNMCDFVLDCNTMEAKFTNLQPSKHHKLHATIKSKNEGFSWRVWSFGDRGVLYAPKTTDYPYKWEAPVVKSNLQKAVRRQDREAAMSSCLQLALIDKQELLRRLPIIAVEDVCLIKGTATIVWLMMAGKKYLSMKEIAFVMRYVDALCLTQNTFFNNKTIKISKRNRISHSSVSYNADLASLNVRATYGGMKGDMEMLQRAVRYYQTNEIIDPMSQVAEIVIPRVVSHKYTLMPEGIDFHPYPWIIGFIHNKTNVPKETIKSIIWNAESAPNNRKPWTIEKMNIAKSEETWPLIKQYLGYARDIVLKRHLEDAMPHPSVSGFC